MHRRHSTRTALVLLALLATGCGGDGGTVEAVPTTPPSERSQVRDGAVVTRGDYGPSRHGPYDLDGRYRATFVQRGDGVDFAAEVPFTAHLEDPAPDGPGKRIKLFERAAATGSRTISARGRYEIVVDFGDSPYEVRLEPLRR
jgi:hypothetical protein